MTTSTATPTDLLLDDLPIGATRLVRIDGRRVCVARTEAGVFAVDHACPHEGYGLTQGQLQGDVLTCAWHNWKFDVTTGECLVGEEAVPTHDVDVDERGAVSVAVRRPDPEELRPRLFASLRRAIEKDYVGQMSRDVVRLLHAGAAPAEIVAVAIEHGAPRSEYGWGHGVAALTDCLAMVDLFDGDERAHPLVQGISCLAEDTRDRPSEPIAVPASDLDAVDLVTFRDAVEREQLERAQSLVRAAIARGDSPEELHGWFVAAVSDHHLSYGHGAIYTQKGFELLDMIGWQHADTVLASLVPSIVYGTREDTLPYMRPFMRALAEVDVGRFSVHAHAAADRPAVAASLDRLRAVLLGDDRRKAVTATAAALGGGAGVEAVLDVVVDVVAERMLRYDVATEHDLDDDFGWLDITHGITYANAVRSHLDRRRAIDDVARDADLVRLTFFCAFLAQWTGRHEWHTGVGPRVHVDALADDLETYGDLLQREALSDRMTAAIDVEHAIKTSRAAMLEATRSGRRDVLDATLRHLTSERDERRVRATVHRSIEFLNGRVRRD